MLFKVHITQGDYLGKGVIVSWVTMEEPGSSTVVYWSENDQKKKKKGKYTSYKYYNYTSGYIHHCTIKNLEVSFVLVFFDWYFVIFIGCLIDCLSYNCSMIPNITMLLELEKLREHSGSQLLLKLVLMCPTLLVLLVCHIFKT